MENRKSARVKLLYHHEDYSGGGSNPDRHTTAQNLLITMRQPVKIQISRTLSIFFITFFLLQMDFLMWFLNGPYKSALRKTTFKNPSAHFFDSKLESEVGSGFLDLVPLRLRVGNQNEVPPNLAHVYDGEFDARSIGTNIQSLWSLNRAPDGLLIFWGPMGTWTEHIIENRSTTKFDPPKMCRIWCSFDWYQN